MRSTPSIPWLPLLQRLTSLSPEWGIWKNADAVLAGHGDVDSVATPAARDDLVGVFHDWASENGYFPVFTCEHIPGVVLVIALDDRDLVELDLCELQAFRGSVMFGAVDLQPMMVMDERGFRRLRTGAEGLLLLLLSGMRHGGRRDATGLQRKSIPRLLGEDWEGVEEASSLFGSAGPAALRLADAVVHGTWDRTAALKVETRAALRAIGDPRLMGRRLLSPVVRDRRCALWPVLVSGRHINGNVGRWLSNIRESHRELAVR